MVKTINHDQKVMSITNGSDIVYRKINRSTNANLQFNWINANMWLRDTIKY